MTIAFFILYSLNRTQVQMNLRGFLIDKEVLLYYIEFTAAIYVRKHPKHCTYCKSSVGYYKRQYLTESSFYSSFSGKNFDVFGSLVDYGRWSLTMYKSWFHLELIINSYVMVKGGKMLDILICLEHKMQVPCLLHLGVGLEVGIFSHG